MQSSWREECEWIIDQSKAYSKNLIEVIEEQILCLEILSQTDKKNGPNHFRSSWRK